MKKSFSAMLLVFVLVLAFAIPASAAATNYQFLDENQVYSSHASAFTYDAVISGNTVTLKFSSTYISGLKVYSSGTYNTITGTTPGDGFIYFTFNVADFDELLPVQLGVNAGPHTGYMNLFVEWL